MSDKVTPIPQDAAAQVLRERVNEIDAEMQTYQKQIDVLTVVRGELIELIGTLTRRPRSQRKAPAAKTTDLPGLAPEEPAQPSVFAPPHDEPPEDAA